MDLALSFQDPARCYEVWERIQEYQAPFYQHQFPLLTYENLKVVAETVEHLLAESRDELLTHIRKIEFLHGLVELSRECIANHDLESCYLAHRIMRVCFQAGDAFVMDELTTANLSLEVVSILEYDPCLRVADGFTRHRRYLSIVHLKNVALVRDAETIQRIHQAFLLSYIRDVILLKYLDDHATQSLTQLLFLKHSTVVTRIFDDDLFRTNILVHLNELARWRPDMDTTPMTDLDVAASIEPMFPEILDLAPPAFRSLARASAMVGRADDDVDPATGAATDSQALTASSLVAPVARTVLTQAAYRRLSLRLVAQLMQVSMTVQPMAKVSFHACVCDEAFLAPVETMLSTTPRDQRWLWLGLCDILSCLVQHDIAELRSVILTLPSRASLQGRSLTVAAGSLRGQSLALPAPSPFLALISTAIVSPHTDDGVRIQLSELLRRLLGAEAGGAGLAPGPHDQETLLDVFMGSHLRQSVQIVDACTRTAAVPPQADLLAAFRAPDGPRLVHHPHVADLMVQAGPAAVITVEQLLHSDALDLEPPRLQPSLGLPFALLERSVATGSMHALDMVSYCFRASSVSPRMRERCAALVLQSGVIHRVSLAAHALVGAHLRQHMSLYPDQAAVDQDRPYTCREATQVLTERIAAGHRALPTLEPAALSLLCTYVRFVRSMVVADDVHLARAVVQAQALDPLMVAFVLNGRASNLVSSSICELLEVCFADERPRGQAPSELVRYAGEWHELCAQTEAAGLLSSGVSRTRRRVQRVAVLDLGDEFEAGDDDGYDGYDGYEPVRSVRDVEDGDEPALEPMPMPFPMGGRAREEEEDDDDPLSQIIASGAAAGTTTLTARTATPTKPAGSGSGNGLGISLSVAPRSPLRSPPSPPLSPGVLGPGQDSRGLSPVQGSTTPTPRSPTPRSPVRSPLPLTRTNIPVNLPHTTELLTSTLTNSHGNNHAPPKLSSEDLALLQDSTPRDESLKRSAEDTDDSPAKKQRVDSQDPSAEPRRPSNGMFNIMFSNFKQGFNKLVAAQHQNNTSPRQTASEPLVPYEEDDEEEEQL
jgi:hypothetical protein